MKNIKKFIGIIIGLIVVVLAGVFFFQKRAVADSAKFTAVTEEYIPEKSEEVVENNAEDVIVDATEEATVEVVEPTAEEVTEEATEETTEETTEEATEEVTEEVTEEATQKATEAQKQTEAATQKATEAQTAAQKQTQAATEAQTQAPVKTENVAADRTEETVKVSYTNVVFKDAYNKYTFATLEEAKAAINVATLTDAEAKAAAINNKTVYASEAAEVLELINAYRTANGLSALTYNDNLATAAMHRAAESAYADWNMTAYENGLTKRHIRPNFEKASSIKEQYGITGNFGENYGRYQASPEEILSGWQNSSAHNALLLSASYDEIGIGVAQDSEGYFYWIALFN